MSPKLRTLCLWTTGVLVLSGPRLKADPPRQRIPVVENNRSLQQQSLEKVLAEGWQVSLRNYHEAVGLANSLRQRTRPDHRLEYALLLVQLKQRKYTDAEKSLKSLLSTYPDYLPLWRARIWFSVVTRKYEVALSEMQLLGQRLAQGTLQVDAEQGAGLVAATDAQLLDLVRWCGQLIGFMEGPAETRSAPLVFQQHQGRLLQGWNEAQAKAFEQGRQIVLRSFAAQQVAIVKISEEADQQVRVRLQELDQHQEKTRKDLKSRREELNEETRELRDVLRDQQQQFREDDRPLADTLWRIDGNSGMAWRSRSYLVTELSWLEGRLAVEVDPILRQQLFSEIDRLRSQLAWNDTDLVSLQNQSWNVQRVRTDLYWEHRRNQQVVNRQIEDSRDSLASVARNEKRLDVTVNRDRRKVQSKSRKVRAAEARAASLQSYLMLPLEQERIRLLNSF
jgi:hypothetical protein